MHPYMLAICDFPTQDFTGEAGAVVWFALKVSSWNFGGDTPAGSREVRILGGCPPACGPRREKGTRHAHWELFAALSEGDHPGLREPTGFGRCFSAPQNVRRKIITFGRLSKKRFKKCLHFFETMLYCRCQVRQMVRKRPNDRTGREMR